MVFSKTVVTLDLDLYERASPIIQYREDLRNSIIIRFGALHIVFAHIRAIGHFIDESGLESSWELAELFGSRKVYSVINCGQGAMNITVETHEKTLSALYAMYYNEFFNHNPKLLTDQIRDLVSVAAEDVKKAHGRLSEAFQTK